MASKRKSTTPCMIPLKTMAMGEKESHVIDEDNEDEQPEMPHTLGILINSNAEDSATGNSLSNGHNITDDDNYVCKYCNFGAQEVSTFIEHIESKHLDFCKDPSYVCIECSFLVKSHEELTCHNKECHTDEPNCKWNLAKHDNQTTVEQSFSDVNSSQDLPGDCYEEAVDGQSEITFTKTPIMKLMKSKTESKKSLTPNENLTNLFLNETEENKGNSITTLTTMPVTQTHSPFATSSLLGTVTSPLVGTVPVIQAGLTQLVSLPLQQHPALLQQPPQHQQLPTSKSLPKVMIPLSYIPTYNGTMDSNCFLKNSFNKFPYPTKAELCYLTVVTEYPEEQIKIWFTAQRLKQGISWSPEEIEDARKKMFHTIIQTVPQPTFTVLNAPIVANASSVQHLFQTALPSHFVGQPKGTGGLFVTQPFITNGMQCSSSTLTLAVASIPNQQSAAQPKTSQVKVVNAAQSLITACPSISSQSVLDSNLAKCKKPNNQLSALKTSFLKSQFPAHSEVEKLTQITGLTRKEVRKWFTDHRNNWRIHKGAKSFDKEEHSPVGSDSCPDVVLDVPLKEEDATCSSPATPPIVPQVTRRQGWHQTPDFTPTKYKERAPEQLKALEGSFAENNFPSVEEVDRLRSETKMTRREIDGWFSERRKKLAEENKKEVKLELDSEDEEDEPEEKEDSIEELKVLDENGSLDMEKSSPMSGERKVSPIKINLKNLKVTDANGKGALQVGALNSPPIDDISRPPTPPKGKLHYKKTAQQRHLLKKLFVKTQWPTNREYDSVAVQACLPRPEVVRWFGDNRYAFKNGQLKWYDDYSKGIFPDGLEGIKLSSIELLRDYYKEHNMLYEDDLEMLCEKTEMMPEEIRMWFAEMMSEDNKALSEAGSGDRHSSFDDQSEIHRGVNDAYSEVSDNSESGEPTAPEKCPDAIKAYSPLTRIPLEGD
ncbi:zinc fingers and homeoboxes protein 3 isoform X2 [Ambystoma mexicanum]|uniref:zinc fingers and homeoboxes protein 3 isoform X2 n=1 Tax=Ambystoma mexicanum TaxID=8296 RepID=UPI0037E9552E